MLLLHYMHQQVELSAHSELNIAMAENAATNGVEFRFNTEVRDIVKKDRVALN